MKQYPRAFYIGGFGVGCGVPRVKILEKTDKESPFIYKKENGETEKDYIYKCQVTSKNAYAYKFGEIMEVFGADLFDKKHTIQGPRLVSIGREWKRNFI
jgi:hypothetical protein